MNNPRVPELRGMTWRRPAQYVITALLALLPLACLSLDSIIPLGAALNEALSIEITTDYQRVFPEGGRPAGRTATTLHANPTGGVAPYACWWSVTNPLGQIENERLNATDIENPVFTAGSIDGEYRVTCVVTDAAWHRVSSSIVLYVNQQLACDLIANRLWVASDGGAKGQAVLEAMPLGGTPPYSYEWSVTAPDGRRDDARLEGATPETRLFTSTATVGAYRITCTVTDATGALAVDSLDVTVSDLLSIDASADHQHVAPGGGAAGMTYLLADVRGGAAPYTYSWAVTTPDGTIDASRLDDASAATPLFVSTSTIGTYRATCTVTDADGQQAMDSILVLVSQDLAMSVATNRQRIVAGGGENGRATLSATVMGGVAPYAYLWSVLDESGRNAEALLNNTTAAAPAFTSGSTPGTYRITCTVTDAAGQVATDALEIVVGQQLVGNLNTSSQWVGSGGLSATSLWVATGGGWAGQATISADVIGGTPPYNYAWTAIDPSGNAAADRLSGTSAAARTFTSTTATGAYQIRCTITDAMGVGFSDSVTITVYDALLIDVTIDRQQMPTGGGANGTAHLSASVAGGTPPYVYAWTITGPDNVIDNARLDDAAIAAPTFTSAALNGIYRATCEVTDAVGQQISNSILFIVGQPISIDVTSDRQDVVAGGGQASLSASVTGGVPPYQYAWTATNPAGATENARLNDTALAAPTFTSDLTIGTYTLTCQAVDASGFSAIKSIMIVVGGGLDQGLSVEVTTTRQSLPAAGEQANLAATATGGVPAIAYAWTVLGPSGDVTAATLNNAAIAGPVFTAPATPGTYRVSCTVTDSVLKTFTASTHIYVGMSLSLDVTTTRQSLPAGQTATLAAGATGGISPYTYAWTVLNPSGADATASLNNAAIAGPTFTAPAAAGTYRATCTVTDTANATFTASIHIYVGMHLSLALTATKASLPGGQTSALAASATGGVSPYAYAWTVLDPTGAGATAALDNAAVATPTFTAPATAGTYRLTCTVTDTANATFTTSMHIGVGMDLSLALTATKASLPGGQTSALAASATGGASPYTYAWTVLDPSGGNANASLSSTAVANPTFTAPAAAGTYRATCTVTDAANATFSNSMHLCVGMGLSLALTSTKESLPSGQTTALLAGATGGVSPYAYAWTVLSPSGADVTAATLSAANVANPTFTAPATAGTYRTSCTVTDAAGATITSAIHLHVGLSLSLDITTLRQVLPVAGETTTLIADAYGGVSSYTCLWTVRDPTGADATAALDDNSSPGPVFTAPAAVGTYQATCLVTDAAGATIVGTLHIAVGMSLSLSLTVTRQSLPTGQAAALLAAPTGGEAPYTYAWTVVSPAGGDVTAATLSNAAVVNPTFTAPATAGTYRVTCTVTDATKAAFTNSLHIYVGLPLSASLATTKQSLPSAQTAALATTVTGGVSPYTYAWTVLDPSGGNANASLSSTAVATPTFTAPAAAGTYRLSCTVTDAAAATFTKSLHIYVGMPLSVALTTTKQSLPSAQTATFAASVTGGVSAYTYAWSVLNPSGGNANASLSSTAVASPTFTAPATAGTYRVTCTVTDSAAATFTTSMHVYVGMPLSVALTTTKQSLPSAQTATFAASVTGGVSAYTYAWSVLDPSGGNANASLSSTAVASPTFTAPATAGTYRATCTVTDSAAATFAASIHVYVGMPLSVALTTTKLNLPSAQTATFAASVTGGVSAYTYAWTVINPASGDVTAATLNASNIASPTFTAPATAGTYRATCTVTDSAAATFTTSMHVYVGMPLSVALTTTKQSLPSAQTATFAASVTGGVSAYTYAWSVLDPSGGNANASLSSTAVASPTFTAPATAGTYRATCTVTDSAAATFAASIHVYVGMPLSVALTTTKQSVPSGQTATLAAAAIGGISPYTYAWIVLSPSSADVTVATLSAANVASPTFTAPATAGTYRATCTVTDSAGTTFSGSLHITAGGTLSLAVTTTKQTMTAAETATLSAAPTGGAAAYTYAWSVLDPGNADVTATVLSSSAVASPTFTAPVTGGTYRCTCAVTDSVGATFAAAVHVYVATSKLTLTTPATADADANPTSVMAQTAMGSLYSITEVGVDLTYARNLKVRMRDPNGNIGNFVWVAVDGVGADGHPQTELLRFVDPHAGSTLTGAMIFSRVDIVRYVRSTGTAPGGDETLQIGIGNIFGLPKIIPSDTSVRRIVELPNTTLATPADYTVVVTPGRQGVSFTNVAHEPDGARSYEIYYDDN